MKFALAVSLLTAASAFAAKETKKSQSGEQLPAGVKWLQSETAIEGSPLLSVYSFSNGIKVLVLPDMRNPLVSLRLKLNGGSNREVLGKTGLAHFFEHMMFRKTQNQEEGYYDRTLAGVGGSGNASTSTDYVSYESTFPAPALTTMLQLERDRFELLDLKDPFFTVEKGAVISERSLRYENDPSARGSEILNEIIEKGSPYEWLTIGAKKDIENMSIADAQSFYRDIYAPDNLQITIGGPMSAETIIKQVHNAFGSWKGNQKKSPQVFPKDYLTRHNGKSFYCSESVLESRIQKVFPNTDNSYLSGVMMSVLNSILSSHPEGDLNYRLNSKKLGIGAYVYKETWQKQFQPASIMLRLNTNQNVEAAETFVLQALDEAKTRPIDAKLKNLILKQWDVEEADAASRMTTLVKNYEWNSYFYGDPFISVNDRKILANLNSAQFRKWMTDTFDAKRSFRYGVVPKSAEVTECANFKKEKVK